MSKARKKNFKQDVSDMVEAPVIEIGGGAADLFNGIPMSGDDMLAELVGNISDRTVDPVRPEPVQIISDIPKDEAPLPEVSGEESKVDPGFIQKVETLRAANPDKSLDEIERMVNINPAPQMQPGQQMNGGGFSSDTSFGDQVQPPIDEGANHIGAQEIVDWYDMLQQLLSVFGYEHFSSPKESNAVSARLLPKIMGGTASSSEREQFQEAQKVLQSYTSRKTRFSETVAMSDDLKQRTVRMLEKILAHRGIQLSPELLLGMLFLTPLIINGGRILLEKMGFGNADEMVGKFNTFVKTQETQYYQSNQ